jgi:hypothetical protein
MPQHSEYITFIEHRERQGRINLKFRREVGAIADRGVQQTDRAVPSRRSRRGRGRHDGKPARPFAPQRQLRPPLGKPMQSSTSLGQRRHQRRRSMAARRWLRSSRPERPRHDVRVVARATRSILRPSWRHSRWGYRAEREPRPGNGAVRASGVSSRDNLACAWRGRPRRLRGNHPSCAGGYRLGLRARWRATGSRPRCR